MVWCLYWKLWTYISIFFWFYCWFQTGNVLLNTVSNSVRFIKLGYLPIFASLLSKDCQILQKYFHHNLIVMFIKFLRDLKMYSCGPAKLFHDLRRINLKDMGYISTNSVNPKGDWQIIHSLQLQNISLFDLVSGAIVSQYRSSRPEVFLRKGDLKICSKFRGEHPCRSVISINILLTVVYILTQIQLNLINRSKLIRKNLAS